MKGKIELLVRTPFRLTAMFLWSLMFPIISAQLSLLGLLYILSQFGYDSLNFFIGLALLLVFVFLSNRILDDITEFFEEKLKNKKGLLLKLEIIFYFVFIFLYLWLAWEIFEVLKVFQSILENHQSIDLAKVAIHKFVLPLIIFAVGSLILSLPSYILLNMENRIE